MMVADLCLWQVSESIIMGIPIAVGTGLFKLLRKTDPLKKDNAPTPLLYQPSFNLDMATSL